MPKRRENVVSANTQRLPETPTLTFTGRRRQNRFEILICGKALHLTHGHRVVLHDLTIAAGRSETGYCRQDCKEVHRLRKSFDAVFGPGAGAKWIQSGSEQEYRLTVSRTQFREQILVKSSYAELAGLGIVATAQAETLLELCVGAQQS